MERKKDEKIADAIESGMKSGERLADSSLLILAT